MIKVNLLSQLRAKKVKKMIEIQYQLSLFGAFLGVLVVVLVIFWFYLNGRVQDLEAEKMAQAQKLAQLKEAVREIESFEQDKRNFEAKIRIIQQLKLNQSGPVHLLDQVSQSLPPRVWLIGLTQQGSSVTIAGKAITNSEIVDFINNLKRSQFFSNIELLESRQKIEDNVPIYDFKLNCRMAI